MSMRKGAGVVQSNCDTGRRHCQIEAQIMEPLRVTKEFEVNVTPSQETKHGILKLYLTLGIPYFSPCFLLLDLEKCHPSTDS